MTPDLIALMEASSELVPRERAVLWALGEADPDMLTLYEIASLTGGHVSGYGSATASLRARGFVGRVDVQPSVFPSERPAPVYRLLPRGRSAVLELRELGERRFDARMRSRAAKRALIGAAA